MSQNQVSINKIEVLKNTLDQSFSIAIIDKNGTITHTNKKFSEVSKYTNEELVGQNHNMFKSVFHLDEFYSTIWKKISNGETWSGEIKNRAKDGSSYWIQTTIVPFLDNTGMPEQYIVISNDITVHKENEEKLKTQSKDLEKKFKVLYDKAPTLMRTISTDGIILDCNEAYWKGLGYTKEEIIGKHILDHTAKLSFQVMKDNFTDWKKTGETKHSEIWCKRKDGSIFACLLNGTNMHDENGTLIGRILALTDLTEIHNAREMLKHQESTIREQYEALKKADIAKDEFSSMITHELKTPLTPIKGHCEILSDPEMMGELNLEQSQSVNEIYVNAIRLERLIADILDVQKLDMNKMSFNKKEFDVRDFIFSIEKDLGRLMKEKQIEFTSIVNHFSMNSDKDRIYQVMNNLIKNSIDFVPSGKGRIEVGAYPKDSNVIWYVKDNGIGIPADKQGNIFKKFYQTDTSVARKHGGTGLGLAICKGIVEGQGGKIWFESKQGEGTTFYFSLPA